MQIITRKRFVVVEAETGAEYADAIDGYLTDSSLKNVEVDHRNRQNFCAYVTFEEVEKIPENAKDEYELDGISFQCRDCPYCKKSEDKRIKHLECLAPDDSGMPRTRGSNHACVFFYEELKAGTLLGK